MGLNFYLPHNPGPGPERGAAKQALAVCQKLFASEKYVEAWGACQAATALDPTDPAIDNAAGVILCKLGRPEEAIAFFSKALRSLPQDANLLANLGNAFQETLRYDLAEKTHRQALALVPGSPLFTRNLADSLARLGQDEQAIALYRQALALSPRDPAVSWGLATSLLRLGRFQGAWEHFEQRWFLNPKNPPRRLEKPRWSGEPFTGRALLLYCEQGLGDTIHCLRYLPLVKARGGKVILEVHPELARLCQGLAGADQVIGRGRDSLPAYDLHYPLLSCPLLFTPGPEAIPADYPYLTPPAEAVAKLASLLPSEKGLLKVGIVWSGSPDFPENRHRSLPLQVLAEGLGMQGVRLYSLQKGPAARELEALAGASQVTDLAEHCRDFADTAGAVTLLDLIVMTDTSVAHLAGALRRPIWLLAPFFAHWVWGPRERRDCAWYPSMRILRQTTPGDWSSPLQEARQGLQELLRGPGGFA